MLRYNGFMEQPFPALPFMLSNGRYHVSSLLAQGGTARIYIAYDNHDRAWRAIKVLRPEYARRTDIRKRLAAEAEALRRLQHPHILRVFESVVGDDAYFVMEYAEQGSIGDWVADHGALPQPAALQVIHQVCGATARPRRRGDPPRYQAAQHPCRRPWRLLGG